MKENLLSILLNLQSNQQACEFGFLEEEREYLQLTGRDAKFS